MIEREATKRFAELENAMRDAGLDHLAEEFETIGREEREQFEMLAVGTAGHELPEMPAWEFDVLFPCGPQAERPRKPRSGRARRSAWRSPPSGARRTSTATSPSAPQRHPQRLRRRDGRGRGPPYPRLEQLLAREPEAAATAAGNGDVLPLKP